MKILNCQWEDICTGSYADLHSPRACLFSLCVFIRTLLIFIYRVSYSPGILFSLLFCEFPWIPSEKFDGDISFRSFILCVISDCESLYLLLSAPGEICFDDSWTKHPSLSLAEYHSGLFYYYSFVCLFCSLFRAVTLDVILGPWTNLLLNLGLPNRYMF